jgi:heme oxygenase
MSILREVTQEKHQAVEALPFIQYLLHGEITPEHYVIYLAEMLEIYRHLENLAAMAGLLDDMPELPRAHRMRQDLDELAPGYQTELTPATRHYLDYLSTLYESDRAGDLFAHVYVRHLGDMYGGKLIARRVPGTGRWYEFDNRADLVKRFNAKLSMDLAPEALVAFDWFGKIFQDLWHRIHTGCDFMSSDFPTQ